MGGRIGKAIIFAILAAVFYAISSPVSKTLMNDIPPDLMAALLYLGAGFGMLIVRTLSKETRASERRLTHDDLPYILAMIVLDIAAPILLMHGLLNSSASSVSLLNNFEIVATTLIAMIVFSERVTRNTIVAIVLITISTMILSSDGGSLTFSTGSLSVIAACICWGLENNCTRKLSDSGAIRIVVIKGIFSGLGALIIATYTGIGSPAMMSILCGLALGFISYGLSLYFYISAQSKLGAAKVSAYYALAPFIGVFLSIVFLGEIPDTVFIVAFLVMALGMVALTKDTLNAES